MSYQDGMKLSDEELAHYEEFVRTTNVMLVLASDESWSFSVEESYVGSHVEVGGNGFRTVGLKLEVSDERLSSTPMVLTVTPWELVELGRSLLNTGIEQLRKVED